MGALHVRIGAALVATLDAAGLACARSGRRSFTNLMTCFIVGKSRSWMLLARDVVGLRDGGEGLRLFHGVDAEVGLVEPEVGHIGRIARLRDDGEHLLRRHRPSGPMAPMLALELMFEVQRCVVAGRWLAPKRPTGRSPGESETNGTRPRRRRACGHCAPGKRRK